MTVVWPGRGTQVSALGSTYRSKAGGEETRGAYSLVEEDFWGDPTPLHTHVEAEEAFYVLSGRAAVWLDDAEHEVGPGAFLLVPRGVPHALRRLTDEPVRFLTLISPPGFERLFDVVAEQGEDALLADLERLVALARDHGTEILGEHPRA